MPWRSATVTQLSMQTRSVSKRTPLFQRGHNLYLPIPYAKSCKVTYESETLDNPRPDKDGKKRKESFYYNVETRTYASGTVVESFSPDVLQREKAAVDAANRVLARRQNGADKVVDETLSFDGTIPPGESVSRTVTREKGGAIRRLAMAVANGKKPQALRSTVLEISFDGERTVYPEDVPGYLERFTKENVLREIREKGVYRLNYRLVIHGEPMHVTLKIAPFKEGEKEKLLVGVREWVKRAGKH